MVTHEPQCRLRFDPNFKAHRTLDAAFARDIVAQALKEDLQVENLEALRAQVYEEKLKARLESFGRKRAMVLFCNISSYLNLHTHTHPPLCQEATGQEEEEADRSQEGDSDSSDEEGLECGLCEDMVPDFFCGDCNKYICEGCHAKRRGAHTKDHAPVTLEEHRTEVLHRRRSSSSSFW
jgi:hypothetical protein